MTEGFTIQLPKVTEKKLLARYDDMLQKAIEKALEDKELYKPIVRMAGLCRWLDISTTTVVKWQKQGGMPHMVIDGVTLYDKHKVAQWLQQFER
ncbi:DNA-binding protein [Streptococcus agalactiae]|uniref:helix-turn-helix domain-containing protein n=1 Tax=Streptococcus agalactiae TaxID=1311 RepID=UPI0005E1DC6A|nr:helix-turn-helix domain-containing protein [Streptococcus agalactiae]CFW70758.1 DNA-binding protein [Streptococcus agalactiae]